MEDVDEEMGNGSEKEEVMEEAQEWRVNRMRRVVPDTLGRKENTRP